MDEDQVLASLGDAMARMRRSSGTILVDAKGRPGPIVFGDGSDCGCQIDGTAATTLAGACGMIDGGVARTWTSRRHGTSEVKATLRMGGPGGSRTLGRFRFEVEAKLRVTVLGAARRSLWRVGALPQFVMVVVVAWSLVVRGKSDAALWGFAPVALMAWDWARTWFKGTD